MWGAHNLGILGAAGRHSVSVAVSMVLATVGQCGLCHSASVWSVPQWDSVVALWRCGLRLWLSQFGSVVFGCGCHTLAVRSSVVAVTVWQCGLRLWLSQFGSAVFGCGCHTLAVWSSVVVVTLWQCGL
eukprot:1144495-Pelagomonas_calceolata.AAC.4